MTSSSPGPECRWVWARAVVLFVSLLGGRGWAQPAPASPAVSEQAADVGPPAEEIVVFGELEVARERQQVINDLRALGYKPGKRKDGYTVFRPESPWKPSVRVYDDGFVVLRRTPPRWQAPGDPNKPLNNLWCLPPFTPMCIRIGGVVVSQRKLQHQKHRVVSSLESDMRDWRTALSGLAMSERLGTELPDQLDALWHDGLSPAGLPVAEPAERRAAILGLWASRTCTPEGAAVRHAVRVYLEHEVQPSAHPVTPDEEAAAEQASACGDVLDLSMPVLDAAEPVP